MTKGTKSLLFGVHHVLWHPLTVWLAWIVLYKSFPTWKENVCIFIHDWGYWGKVNMDDEEGEKHPEFAANLARRWYGSRYEMLCLMHSRHYARKYNAEPSKLCWADKYSIIFEPCWFYITRARLSGELAEYREICDKAGLVPESEYDRVWFKWIQAKMYKMGREQKASTIPYANAVRGRDQF